MYVCILEKKSLVITQRTLTKAKFLNKIHKQSKQSTIYIDLIVYAKDIIHRVLVDYR